MSGLREIKKRCCIASVSSMRLPHSFMQSMNTEALSGGLTRMKRRGRAIYFLLMFKLRGRCIRREWCALRLRNLHKCVRRGVAIPKLDNLQVVVETGGGLLGPR